MRKLTPRETFLLVAVAGVAVIGIVYGRGGTLGVGGAGDANLAPLNYADPPIVELARLGLEPDDADAGRDLFSYYVPPPPPRPQPPPRPAPKPREQTKQQPVERKPPPMVPPTKQTAPRPTFRYIGFMGPKDGKIAVFEKGEEVLLAGIGEVVDNQFKVLEFKYERLVLGYTAEKWADETTELAMKR